MPSRVKSDFLNYVDREKQREREREREGEKGRGEEGGRKERIKFNTVQIIFSHETSDVFA